MPKKLSLKTTSKEMTVNECFQSFIDKCVIKNLSPETIKFYQNQFHVFLESLDDKECLIADISSRDIDNFILYLRKKGTCNDITINSYLRGIRAFLYYAMDEGYLSAFHITIPKTNKKIYEENGLELFHNIIREKIQQQLCGNTKNDCKFYEVLLYILNGVSFPYKDSIKAI